MLAVLVVVPTVAPRCFASWIAKLPIPPEPAGINTFCPARSFARSVSACQEVRLTIGSDAACTKSRVAGFNAARFSGTRTNSASEPVPLSKILANTSSPALKRVTRRPVATTTPDTSLPNVAGRLKCRTRLNMPVGIMLSIGFRPTAYTLTRISSSPGEGKSTSSNPSSGDLPE